MARRLDDKVILVTGASAGIGAAVCREIVGRGGRVVALARRLERLEGLAESCGEALLPAAGDVRRREDLDQAVAAARESWGRLDMALANAGFGVGKPVVEIGVEDFRRQLETNFFGVLETFYACRAELEQSRGVFAVTGSVAGHLTPPGSVPYSVSKFAVRALAQGLWAEMRPSGVAVVLLSPGFVESEIRQVDNSGELRPEWRDPVPGWLRMSSERAARQVVGAMAARRREAVITGHGKVLVFMSRHLPRTTAWLMGRSAKTASRRRR